MPDKPSWIERVPQIMEVLRQSPAPLLDRQAVQNLFSLSARQANRLIQSCPDQVAIGRSVLIPPQSLLGKLELLAKSGSVEREQLRQQRVRLTLGQARQDLHRRSISIPVSVDVYQTTFADLPAGVVFEPGTLKVSFASSIELLEKLFALSQAIANDYTRFNELVSR